MLSSVRILCHQGLELIPTSVACFACNPKLQCDELVKLGASIGETPAAVAKKCKIIVAMLSDPSAALSVGVFHVGI